MYDIHKKDDGLRTKLNWAREGYILNDDAAGEPMWTNRHCTQWEYYYSADQVHADEQAAKQLLRDVAREYRQNAKEWKEYERKQTAICKDMREKMKTEWQWLQAGRIPNRDADWRSGYELNRKYQYWTMYGENYAYCHIDDTREPISPEELEEAKKELLMRSRPKS